MKKAEEQTKKPNKRMSNRLVWIIAFTITACLLIVIYGHANSAYNTAMSSNDIKEIDKAIDSIEDPQKLYKISLRCQKEANSIYAGNDINAHIKKINWMGAALEASEKAEKLGNK
jgi:hypothetical protein